MDLEWPLLPAMYRSKIKKLYSNFSKIRFKLLYDFAFIVVAFMATYHHIKRRQTTSRHTYRRAVLILIQGKAAVAELRIAVNNILGLRTALDNASIFQLRTPNPSPPLSYQLPSSGFGFYIAAVPNLRWA